MSDALRTAPSTSTTGPRRQNKRRRVGVAGGSSSKDVHSLLETRPRTIDVPMASSSSVPLKGRSPKASPAPAVLTSALGVVSTTDFEAELAKQLLGVIPESKEANARRLAEEAAKQAELMSAPANESVADPVETAEDGADGQDPASEEERRRKAETDHPILAWLAWDETYLRESIRIDGRGDALKMKACPGCKAPGRPDFTCLDCEGAHLCRTCIVSWHLYQPFHRIFDHSKGFPHRVHGQDLGFRIQLMHLPGEKCEFRELAHVDNFTILHTTGIHRIRVDFCYCDKGKDVPRPVQLLRRRLWPSTVVEPQSATAFNALDDFTGLSLLGRLTAYDYHKAAAAKTDGAHIQGLPDVRQQFMTCVHEFRHIMMFKRAGRGHEVGGIEKTPIGACAVRCPACPDTKMNLVPDWGTKPLQWMYRAILSLDANFRLSNRLSRSTTESDPYLNDGRAYMPPAEDYQAHLKQMEGVDFVETPSDCSRFGAINQANMKAGRGLRTTGVGACTCGRHEFWQPNGVTTLLKGESMDYAFCGAMKHIRAPTVLVTYDIACQWHKKLKQRLEKIPTERQIYAGGMAMLELILADEAVFCVPKFHLYAHKLICQISYALGWTVGTGLSDGEGPERCWSAMNGAASSVREMGPGTMHDTMDDLFGAWNWLKLCHLGRTLAERMWRAVTEGRQQSAVYTEFTEALEEEDAEELKKWRRKVEMWEAAPQKRKNPYNVKRKTATIKQITLETAIAQGKAATAVVQAAHASETSTTSKPLADASSSLQSVARASGLVTATSGGSGINKVAASAPPQTSVTSSGGQLEVCSDGTMGTGGCDAAAKASGGPAKSVEKGSASTKRKAPLDPDGDYELPERVDTESSDEDDQDQDDASAGDGDVEHGAQAADVAGRAQFLLLGLKIELDRYRISNKRGEDGETLTLKTAQTKALNALKAEIVRFRTDQERYMPELHTTLTVEELNPDRTTALTVKLHLPSDMARDDPMVPEAVRAMEIRLRWASMSDELENLLHQLRLRGILNKFKILNISGQRANTRARTAQDAVDVNVKTAANSYRRHRIAYMALVGPDKSPTGWETTMRELADSDCRGLGDRLIEQMEKMSAEKAREFVASRKGKASSGETGFTLPWIWYKTSAESSGLQISDELMLEWLKNRARARNWVEEVWLLDEEMGRALRFNESMARIWDARAYPNLGDPEDSGVSGSALPPTATLDSQDNGDDQHVDGENTATASTAPLGTEGHGEHLDEDALADIGFATWAKALRKTIAHDVMGSWDADEAWADGVRAYAQKQGWIRRQQALLWEKQWSDARAEGQQFMKYHGLDGISREPLVMLPPSESEVIKKKVERGVVQKKTKRKKGGKKAPLPLLAKRFTT